ncbi:unnamed protein product, partial [Callosobruchus maculatus]
ILLVACLGSYCEQRASTLFRQAIDAQRLLCLAFVKSFVYLGKLSK